MRDTDCDPPNLTPTSDMLTESHQMPCTLIVKDPQFDDFVMTTYGATSDNKSFQIDDFFVLLSMYVKLLALCARESRVTWRFAEHWPLGDMNII